MGTDGGSEWEIEYVENIWKDEVALEGYIWIKVRNGAFGVFFSHAST